MAFGELGYDISIDQGGRLGEKPVLWNYYDDTQRKKLFEVYSAMLQLRAQFDVFTSGKETLSVTSELKKIQLSLNDHNITVLGNFGLSDQSIIPEFQHTGTWFEFFTGNETSVSNVSSPISLKAGEFRLYSDKKLPSFNSLVTTAPEHLSNADIRIFPNPATDRVQIESQENILQLELISLNGHIIRILKPNTPNPQLELNGLNSGLYFVRVKTRNQTVTEKIVKY